MAKLSALRDKIKEHLLRQIQNGELQVGKTINLAALSRVTGISVTPIREALTQLEQAQVIQAVPNRGFVVAKLSKQEVKNLIEIVAQLEVMALESSKFEPDEMDALARMQSELEATTTISEGLRARFNFHNHLVQHCPNKVLLQILKDLKVRLHFYEHDFIKDHGFFKKLSTQTRSVVDAIQEDNVPTAALILRMHWMSILEHIEAQISVKNG
ncbi:GntR family transcriptional regulator [Muricauda ruestringensis]|mgnify:FL=1|uniref:GntR family transcriptional regulator n=1 Tax=Flagellimonas aurea TaxID=2915619 RepID=A0ABS3G8G2_9FLAO|nr:GntR family transcriptional regulator [Allomuricauda aurea]MBO0355714.1 GntR family transcriptional regulator [Allomuricauda aurea]|tara:strand:+ start:440 stop:1078 length:639 start_codon:yes stop_codon:yes gene_type:complete